MVRFHSTAPTNQRFSEEKSRSLCQFRRHSASCISSALTSECTSAPKITFPDLGRRYHVGTYPRQRAIGGRSERRHSRSIMPTDERGLVNSPADSIIALRREAASKRCAHEGVRDHLCRILVIHTSPGQQGPHPAGLLDAERGNPVSNPIRACIAHRSLR